MRSENGSTTSAGDATLGELVRQHPAQLLGIAFTSFSGGMAEAVFLVAIVRVIFSVTEESDRVELFGDLELAVSTTLLLAAGLLAFRLVMAIATSWQAAQLANNVVATVRRRLVSAYLDAAWGVQELQRAGSMQELASSYTGSVTNYLTALSQTVLASGNLLALLGIAVFLDPIGAIGLVVAVGALATLLKPVRAAVGRRSHRATDARMQFATRLNEYSLLAMELKIFNTGDTAGHEIGDLIERSRRTSVRFSFLSGLMSPVYSVLAYTVLLIVLYVIWMTDTGDLPTLGAVMLVVLRSLGYGQALQGSLTQMSAARPVAVDLFDEIHRLESNREHQGTLSIDSVDVLMARDVCFAYETDEPVLEDVSFTIRRNEIIGIVGPSGSGKSTLVQLLLGLRSPMVGTIAADGQDIREIDRKRWTQLVTFVPQSPRFLAGSIRDNIRLFRDSVTDEDIERAARLAHIHDEIMQMPAQYARSVGERGGHLSGGQQQRLCIARALIEDPDVLVLDEPTSALDMRSEHLLRKTMLTLKERMSVIVIAHRLSTLDMCDRIMVIQAGRIVGFDRPDRLAESNEFYREALELSGLR